MHSKNLTFGLANGGDILSGARCATEIAGQGVFLASAIAADALDIASSAMDAAKEDVEQQASIEIEIAGANTVLQAAKELEKLMREEPLKRLEAYARREQVEAARGNYQIQLANGQRLLSEMAQFRANSAADIQTYRYRDMAFGSSATTRCRSTGRSSIWRHATPYRRYGLRLRDQPPGLGQPLRPRLPDADRAGEEPRPDHRRQPGARLPRSRGTDGAACRRTSTSSRASSVSTTRRSRPTGSRCGVKRSGCSTNPTRTGRTTGERIPRRQSLGDPGVRRYAKPFSGVRGAAARTGDPVRDHGHVRAEPVRLAARAGQRLTPRTSRRIRETGAWFRNYSGLPLSNLHGST
ncbi:MAG: hypothetical protein R2862_00610 [Thermoanaerobaculia bacterium]